MRPTQDMLDAKLEQIAKFKKKYGDSPRVTAMEKYCTDKKYRERVHAFQDAVKNTMNHYPMMLGDKQAFNETNYYE